MALNYSDDKYMRFLSSAADLLLGANCPNCGAPSWGACAQCLAQIRLKPSPVWRNCPDGSSALQTWTVTSYEPPISRLIVAYKDHQASMLKGVLAECLAFSATSLLAEVDAEIKACCVLVPVPSSRAAIVERGFDHLGVLAHAAAKLCHLPCAALLSRQQKTPDQASLTGDERWVAQTGTMRAKDGQQNVVIVDDIVTTGATLLEATKTLVASGYHVIGRATIANTLKINQ